MTDHAFPEAWRRGLYKMITRRRDMRAFLADPIPDETLARILMAAHQAGSVGLSQPWNFLVVENRETRAKVRAHVEVERLCAAEMFDQERREKYLIFKLEGILDSPLNICVTCDHERFGPTVIGGIQFQKPLSIAPAARFKVSGLPPVPKGSESGG